MDAPSKFVRATNEDLIIIGTGSVQRILAELQKEDQQQLSLVDIVVDEVLKVFPGFRSVGLDDLKNYIGQSGPTALYDLTKGVPAEELVPFLTDRLVLALKTFRDAVANNTVPANVLDPAYTVATESHPVIVEEVHGKEEEAKEKADSDAGTQTEVQAPNGQAEAPVTVLVVGEQLVDRVIEGMKDELSLGGEIIVATVKEFITKNDTTVFISTAERAQLHVKLKDALFNMLNNLDYEDFRKVYTEVIRQIVPAQNGAFSVSRVSMNVEAMGVPDAERTAYVALLGFLTHAIDAVADPAIWHHVSIMSVFEKHAAFTQVARANIAEFYRHIIGNQ